MLLRRLLLMRMMLLLGKVVAVVLGTDGRKYAHRFQFALTKHKKYDMLLVNFSVELLYSKSDVLSWKRLYFITIYFIMTLEVRRTQPFTIGQHFFNPPCNSLATMVTWKTTTPLYRVGKSLITKKKHLLLMMFSLWAWFCIFCLVVNWTNAPSHIQG